MEKINNGPKLSPATVEVLEWLQAFDVDDDLHLTAKPRERFSERTLDRQY